jgi:hypothetical protein
MKTLAVRTFVLGAALISAVYGQNNQRQAAITGAGSSDRGKCTLEVVVDGVAQVEIRGATASLRTVSGQPAQWRRFECNAAMPANPTNFRFAGVDGRGKQELLRDPANGGVAIVQIEDPNGGREGYTFDVMWDARGNAGGNNGGNAGGNRGDNNGGNGQYNPNTRPPIVGNPPGRDNNQYPAGAGNNQYPGRADNNQYPGRADNNQYPGRADNNRNGSGDQYRPDYRNSGYYRRYGHGFAVEEAVRVCKEAVARQATRRFRSSEMHFLRTDIDDNPGRQDWVVGSMDVHRGPRDEQYGFSCSVNFDTGQVRSADLDARPTRSELRPR